MPSMMTQNCHKQLCVIVLIVADHGKGAWRSYLKIFSCDGKHQGTFQEQAKHEKKRIMGDCGYYISQTVSIVCKKFHPEILTSTVMKPLDEGYDMLKGSQLLTTQCEETGETKSIFIPMGASSIEVRDLMFIVQGNKMTNIEKKVGLVYSVYGGQGPLSFSTINKVGTEKMETAANAKIVLIFPSFALFVTGDMSFYTDSCGDHKACSYWCVYFLLNRLQWQSDGHEKRDLWTK
jgi:hypothetical protein